MIKIHSYPLSTLKNQNKKTINVILKLIFKANYKKAYYLTKQNYFKNKNDLISTYLYAVLLGDYQEKISAKTIERNRKKSVKLLNKVLSQLTLVPTNYHFSIQNEYFWFSKQYLKQFRLGVSEVKLKNWKGYYSMGVGAAKLAEKYARQNNQRNRRIWALKSKEAWKNYFKYEKKYYSAFAFYSLALGLLSDSKGMHNAQRKACNLCGKNLNYYEFKKIREIIQKLD